MALEGLMPRDESQASGDKAGYWWTLSLEDQEQGGQGRR